MTPDERTTLDEAIVGNQPHVRSIIAGQIGETLIKGFEGIGLSPVDAMYAALEIARALPYERLRRGQRI